MTGGRVSAFESSAGAPAGGEASRLIFPPGAAAGFATAASSRVEIGNPEPVVRELLQNCLDARPDDNQDNPVEVVITLRDVPTEEIPALTDYREAFELARSQRKEAGALSAIEEQIIERIDSTLASETMSVLFCRDNGQGLNPERMEKVLSESNTGKGREKGGAGSVGLGHLTAFAASDLRYVCYAGRYESDRHVSGSDLGDLETISSGHAVLAAHICQGETRTRSSDGILAFKELDKKTLFDPSYEFLEEPPSLLHPELSELGNSTGSVVAICGFDDFREEDSEGTLGKIAEVAAAHFLSALVKRRMTISVRDERTQKSKMIDSNTVEDLLKPGGASVAKKGESFPPGLVSRAYQTLTKGMPLTGIEGTKLWFRKLETTQKPQVNVFRDGMWITKSAPGLERSVFSSVQPFDAVLLPDNSDRPRDFYSLIRDSEGADHMEINLKALDEKKKKKLRELLQKVRECLKEAAGEVSEDTYVPEGFARFSSEEVREAESLPSPSPRPAPDNGPKPPPEPEPDPPPPPPRPTRRKPGPRTGRKVPIASSLRPLGNDKGQICGAKIWINEHQHGTLGVRVYVNSGSDQTCERLLTNKFVKISEDQDSFEIVIDDSVRNLSLNFPEPLPDAVGLSVEFIRRKG